jgi:predicted dehydrogenase
MNPVRVVLAGVHGHGRWHLANLHRLTESGVVRLVGVCDTRPAPPELSDVDQSDDLAKLIGRTGAEITILCTPIHTHADLAEATLHAGSHLLLEKPPAASLADFERISTAVRATGLACQVGFQSLGSEAIPFLRKEIADGGIGRVHGIGAAGAWDRPAAYYVRAPWSGRRRLNGVAVTDGALTNPFAHAVATALAVAEAELFGAVREIDVELYHANTIEADDTSCIRLRLADGTVITVAVSLCAARRHEPYLIVHGETGQARLTYTLDEVQLRRSGERVTTSTHARTDLLENLVAHVRTGSQLLVPLTRTGAFAQVVEAIRLAAEPRRIGQSHQEITRDSSGEITRRVLPGIAELTTRSAERLALYSELDLPWAPGEHTLTVAGRGVGRYWWRQGLPTTVAPRPYLHPVRTLSGLVVSEAEPVDHPHHLGVGVAVADVGGTNFWGGRTFLPDRGPVWRHDHGSQRHVRFARRDSTGFVDHLEWLDPHGVPLLAEERTVAAVPLDQSGCWALDFTFTLTNLTDAPLMIKSSATKGRAGAGYGGFFWRAPGSATHRGACGAGADGADGLNGIVAPWVAMWGRAANMRYWTLVFAQPDSADPWFVRVKEYPGVGLSLAWDQPLPLRTSLTRHVITVVADGRLDRAESAALAGAATER